MEENPIIKLLLIPFQILFVLLAMVLSLAPVVGVVVLGLVVYNSCIVGKEDIPKDYRAYVSDVLRLNADFQEKMDKAMTVEREPSNEEEAWRQLEEQSLEGRELCLDYVRQLRSLEPPPELAAIHSRAVSYAEGLPDVYDDLHSAAVVRDYPGYQRAAARILELLDSADQLDDDWSRAVEEAIK